MMRKVFFILLVISCAACSEQEKTGNGDEYESEIFPLSENVNVKGDSLLYLFDAMVNDKYIYWLQYLKFHEVAGTKIYQGDIELQSNIPPLEATDSLLINTLINKVDTLPQQQLIIGETLSNNKLWENSTVRFNISTDGTTPGLRQNILKAILEWKKTGLRFEEISNSVGDFILFESSDSYKFNSSPVGRRGGMQKIKLVPTASTGNIMHEIGHAVGLWHEHSRPDRDQFIQILYNNIETGYATEFEAVKGPFSYHATNYDYVSIMHYGETSFAKTSASGVKLISIKPLKAGVAIGQRNSLSSTDISGVKKMYQL